MEEIFAAIFRIARDLLIVSVLGSVFGLALWYFLGAYADRIKDL